MSVDIYIYDDQCNVLRQALRAQTSDPNGVVLASGTCAHIGPEWGVTLKTGVPPIDVYEVVVDDPGSTFAPFFADDLNGVPAARIDAVLLPLPTGGGTGPAPGAFGDVADYIEAQPWEDAEKRAVHRLVRAAAGTARYRERAHWKPMLARWTKTLDRFGISATLFTPRRREMLMM